MPDFAASSPSPGTALTSLWNWVAERSGSPGSGPRLELVCAEHPDPERGNRAAEVIRLPGCASEAPLHGLFELLTAGAHSVVIRLDGCANQAAALAHFEALTALLEAASFGRFKVFTQAPTAQAKRTVLLANQLPVSRRKLLTLGLGTRSQATPPDLSSSDPERLNFALRELLGPTSADLSQVPARALAFTAAGCTACNVCVRACPSDALVLQHGPANDGLGASEVTISSLSQIPANCDACTLCVQSCPQDVLKIAGTWDWGTVLDQPTAHSPIVSRPTAKCTRCGARFPATTTGPGASPTGSAANQSPLCQVCSYRRKNPFSSMSPPDLRLGPTAAR